MGLSPMQKSGPNQGDFACIADAPMLGCYHASEQAGLTCNVKPPARRKDQIRMDKDQQAAVEAQFHSLRREFGMPRSACIAFYQRAIEQTMFNLAGYQMCLDLAKALPHDEEALAE